MGSKCLKKIEESSQLQNTYLKGLADIFQSGEKTTCITKYMWIN